MSETFFGSSIPDAMSLTRSDSGAQITYSKRGFTMKILLIRHTAIVVAAVVLFAYVLYAQAPGTGAIRGNVYDPSGSVIRSAQVLLKSERTGAERSASTDAVGSFHFQLLTPGPYTVTVKAAGFTDKSANSVEVVVSETSVMDFRMPVANVATPILVEP